ncbi:hypothetical protein ABPG75_010992 [Micractinium tetrahymenae]
MVVVGWALPTVVEAPSADHQDSGAALAVPPIDKRARAAVGSPVTVTTLLEAAAAASAAGPSTPVADEGSATTSSAPASAASTGRRAALPRPASPSLSRSHSQSDSRSQGSSVAPGELHAVAVHAQAVASRRHELSLQHLRSSSAGGGSSSVDAGVDIPSLVERLKQRPLTGQVAAWAWARAAALSAVRRTMPAQLFSSLWPATEACACRMMPQDVLEMLESWLSLMQQCPRHFRLSRGVVQALTNYGLPAAVKRMGEDQLAQLAALARDIALHRSDADMQISGAAQPHGSSARDLMQPVFALVAAETAWRCSNPARYVSPETISTVVTAAPAWSWRVVRHRDSPALASLKLATAAALEELVPHSPRDLPSSAFGKLKTAISPRGSEQLRR